MRYKTQELVDLRWEVVKSMLNESPELCARVEQFLLNSIETDRSNAYAGELGHDALGEFKRKRKS